MAEAILKLVIEKLADASIKETLSLYRAESKLNSLQDELQWIQAFLKDAESKRKSDERMKTWVSDVRKMAYRIEDTIDRFIAEVDNHNRRGKLNALKSVLKNPTKFPAVHNLICEMDDIQTGLREIEQRTKRYGINKELGDSSGSAAPRKPVILADEDDPDVVGLHKDTENIINLLIDPNIKERRVVSIVGQGGLGKTTLARKAYNSDKVKKDFKFRLWLSISQQFKVIDLLKTMLEKFRPLTENEKELLQKEDPISQQRAKEYFIIKLNASLKNIHYLIIMDDVWERDLWSEMKEALPDVKNGSRVLVTTRSSDIARRADPTCDPYKLDYLSEEQSEQLLLKKAFPGQDPKTYSHELSDLPKMFAKLCGFLPLALVVLGSLLSRAQQPTYNYWHEVFRKFSWNINDDGKECMEILETSYEDLPIHLKPCFMYFGLFPEDCSIKAKSLIRMWVAEGFIPEENSKTMEETAEDYLKELVQRSMIQVSWRCYNGSIKYCRIHDLLRDLAIQKAKETGFLEIQGGNCSSSSIRRMSLDYREYGSGLGPNLRTLFYLLYSDLPNLAGLKLLKVLNGNIVGNRSTNYSHVKWDIFKDLTQLRYIEIPGTLYLDSWWKMSINVSVRKFSKIINLIRNLQTLIISVWLERSQTVDHSAFNYIWNIKTLRHVIVWGIHGPPSTAELTNLQTLKWAQVRTEWVTKGWPAMPNIRVLKLRGFTYTDSHLESLRTFLSGLHHLTSLHIDSKYPWKCDGEMTDPSVLPCYRSLQSLYLFGKMIGSKVTESSFPIHLIKLKLNRSNIKEDPMPILEKLKSLKLLALSTAYEGRQLCCSAGGFPRLQRFILDWEENLEEWKAEEGAMPMLKEINIDKCPKLRVIPVLQQMTSLNKLYVRHVSSDLIISLREDESHKIRDGQFVQVDIIEE